jgi:hypothetical protein
VGWVGEESAARVGEMDLLAATRFKKVFPA